MAKTNLIICSSCSVWFRLVSSSCQDLSSNVSISIKNYFFPTFAFVPSFWYVSLMPRVASIKKVCIVAIKYVSTVYPKKYAHGFCFAVLCCGYTLTDFPISIRLTSLALWQSNDCPSASKATLMNMDKYFMWIHYERLHNHNKAKHNKTVCIFLGIYCIQDMKKNP